MYSSNSLKGTLCYLLTLMLFPTYLWQNVQTTLLDSLGSLVEEFHFMSELFLI